MKVMAASQGSMHSYLVHNWHVCRWDEMIFSIFVMLAQVGLEAYILGTLFHYVVKKDAKLEEFRCTHTQSHAITLSIVLTLLTTKLTLTLAFTFIFILNPHTHTHTHTLLLAAIIKMTPAAQTCTQATHFAFCMFSSMA